MVQFNVEGAHFQPCMDSFLGAALGVLNALGEDLSYEELWGLSGMAFRTQVHRELAPAGLFPRQWDETYGAVMQRLGYACSAGLRDHFYTQDDIHYLRRGWMGNLERHLGQGLPAIAYGLHGPAFGIISGFDDETENFRVSTLLDGVKDGPVHVNDLGLTNPPCVFVLIPTGPLHGYDRQAATRAAIAHGLLHHAQQERDEHGQSLAIPPDLATGMDAFEAWGRALNERTVKLSWAPALYAGYYLEARTHGAGFLRKVAQEYFPQHAKHLELAAESCMQQAAKLRELAALFPPQEPHALQDAQKIVAAIGHLQVIAQAHAAAMTALAEAK